MALRKPIVISDAKPLVRYVKKLQAGEIFQSSNRKDFEKKVMKIFRSQKNYYPKSDSEIRDLIDWSIDGKNLVALYNLIKMNN